ncbi:hypothetical protein AVEN_75709-1 [Araneus ventricosus]|uniref:Uncharacterized protein n=1 Tax=Araneus ventricosus TaxID=182803 RepID=A0A4Y2S6V7_ARAVE|nr:hypothetical protein AVEN_75709-1 [Araneus ventricosus]
MLVNIFSKIHTRTGSARPFVQSSCGQNLTPAWTSCPTSPLYKMLQSREITDECCNQLLYSQHSRLLQAATRYCPPPRKDNRTLIGTLDILFGF